MDKYYIKSKDWEKIYAFLLKEKAVRVGNSEKTRVFMEGVYFIMRTGSQWRELPSYYGKWRSVHKRFESWSRKVIWNTILSYFTEGYDGESVMIDATIVRAHPCAAGYAKGQGEEECLGRSKRWIYHKNPCGGRCIGTSIEIFTHSRPTA